MHPTPTCTQLADCREAARKGVLYEKPSGRVALEEQEHQHTVHQLHDDLKHKHGLVQHAAGGVGTRGGCRGGVVGVAVGATIALRSTHRVYGVVRHCAVDFCHAPQVEQEEGQSTPICCSTTAAIVRVGRMLCSEKHV